MKLKPLAYAVLLASPILLNGCGSSSSSGSPNPNPKEITVAPSLGKISDATVRLYKSDSTTLLGTGELSSDGNILISYSGSYAGPIVVVVSGDEDATYFDEASGTNINFVTGKQLRAIVPSGTTETTVSMLTELAYQISLSNSIALTDTSVAQLNELVRQALTPELTSIISVPLLFDSSTTTGALANDESGRYALRLAALAQLGSGATPALSIAEQLAQDFADGTLDGMAGSSAIAGLLYNSSTFATELNTHLSTIAATYGSSALQTALSSYTAISGTIDFSGLTGSGSETNELPSFVASKVVMMEYCCSASGSPYANGEQVQFTFSGSGALFLTEQSTEVAGSFTMRGSEYIWVDTQNSVEYALSVANNAINEVNIQGIGGTPFYGQFTPIEDETEEPVTLEPVGDGSALNGLSGATGTVSSTTYTYTGHPVEGAALYAYAPLNDTGIFTAYNGNDAITRWTISGFPASVGNVECGTDGSLPYVSLTLNGVPYLATECVIEIFSVSTTEVEGRFAASLSGLQSSLGTVTDGYFRYVKPEEAPTGGLGSQEYGYSMDVDGVEVTDNQVLPLDGFDRQVANFLTLGDTPVFQIRMIPEGVSGSYTCGQGPNSFRLVSMAYDGYSTDNSSHPGSCSVNITYAAGIYSGTFSGTLFNSAGQSIAITNGIVRNDGTGL